MQHRGKKENLKNVAGKMKREGEKSTGKWLLLLGEKRGYYAPKVELGGWASNIKR